MVMILSGQKNKIYQQKYWEKAYGSTLGRASGSGWVTELIARLTETPVQGSGCVNRTMDLDPTSFPVLPPNAPRIVRRHTSPFFGYIVLGNAKETADFFIHAVCRLLFRR